MIFLMALFSRIHLCQTLDNASRPQGLLIYSLLYFQPFIFSNEYVFYIIPCCRFLLELIHEGRNRGKLPGATYWREQECQLQQLLECRWNCSQEGELDLQGATWLLTSVSFLFFVSKRFLRTPHMFTLFLPATYAATYTRTLWPYHIAVWVAGDYSAMPEWLSTAPHRMILINQCFCKWFHEILYAYSRFHEWLLEREVQAALFPSSNHSSWVCHPSGSRKEGDTM